MHIYRYSNDLRRWIISCLCFAFIWHGSSFFIIIYRCSSDVCLGRISIPFLAFISNDIFNYNWKTVIDTDLLYFSRFFLSFVLWFSILFLLFFHSFLSSFHLVLFLYPYLNNAHLYIEIPDNFLIALIDNFQEDNSSCDRIKELVALVSVLRHINSCVLFTTISTFYISMICKRTIDW